MQTTWPLTLFCILFELIMTRTLMSFLGGRGVGSELTVKRRRGRVGKQTLTVAAGLSFYQSSNPT